MAETRIILIAVALAWPLSHSAFAQTGNHGDGHAEMHATYEEWKDYRGFSCCDDSDCRPVRADAGIDGQWRAWVDGRWVPVPPNAVLQIKSPDGRNHICMSPGAVEPRCFVPGEPRS
jgi:hypothetical protein